MQRFAVDGSNIGRVSSGNRPALELERLRDAVAALKSQTPAAEVYVMVDRSDIYGRHVSPEVRDALRAAIDSGELLEPPSGTADSDDRFLLGIAAQYEATVVSNDEYRDLVEDYPWLRNRGRLLGAQPIKKLGWTFTPRIPRRARAKTRRSAQERHREFIPASPPPSGEEAAGREQESSSATTPLQPGEPLNETVQRAPVRQKPTPRTPPIDQALPASPEASAMPLDETKSLRQGGAGEHQSAAGRKGPETRRRNDAAKGRSTDLRRRARQVLCARAPERCWPQGGRNPATQ